MFYFILVLVSLSSLALSLAFPSMEKLFLIVNSLLSIELICTFLGLIRELKKKRENELPYFEDLNSLIDQQKIIFDIIEHLSESKLSVSLVQELDDEDGQAKFFLRDDEKGNLFLEINLLDERAQNDSALYQMILADYLDKIDDYFEVN